MKDFTKKISHREMAFFLMPIIFMKLFEQISGIAGTVVVNRLLSADVITAISACRVYPILQNNLIGAAATGFGIYVTRYIGKKDKESLKNAVSVALKGAGILTVFGFVLLLFLNPLMALIQVPADIYELSKSYLFWLFAGSGALVLQNLFLSMLYGMGESAVAGGASAAGVCLQPLLTFLFVRYGEMGIGAVPLASLANRLTLTVVLLGYLVWKYRTLLSGRLCKRSSLDAWKALWSCGTSGALMFTLVWCGTFMIQRQVNQMSAAHISGYMYAVLVEDLLLIPIWATKDAAAYIMAQNAGAGKVTQLRKYFWRLNRLEWLFCLIVWGVIWLWGPSVIRFVVGPASEEVTSYVERWFQICMIGFPALSMDQIGGVSLQAMGAYRTMGFLGLLEGVLGIVLAVFVINGSGFDGIAGSYLCIFLSMGIAFGLSCHMVLKRMGEERINGV